MPTSPRRWREAKLDWVASANPLENFPELMLTPEQRALMDRYKDPTMRELIKDTCLPRQLRHDVFVRGARRIRNDERDAALARLTVVPVVSPGELQTQIRVPARPGGGRRTLEEDDGRRDARADDDRRSAGPRAGAKQPGGAGEHAGGFPPVPDRDETARRAARLRQPSQPRVRRARADDCRGHDFRRPRVRAARHRRSRRRRSCSSSPPAFSAANAKTTPTPG